MDFGELAKKLGNDLIEGAKGSLKEVTDDSKAFFMSLGVRYAKAYEKQRTGDARAAEESIEALNIAAGSEIAERGLDLVEHGEQRLLDVIATVGKVVLTLALA